MDLGLFKGLALVGTVSWLFTEVAGYSTMAIFRSHLEMTVNAQLLLCIYLITDLGDASQCTKGKAVQLQIKYLSM